MQKEPKILFPESMMTLDRLLEGASSGLWQEAP